MRLADEKLLETLQFTTMEPRVKGIATLEHLGYVPPAYRPMIKGIELPPRIHWCHAPRGTFAWINYGYEKFIDIDLALLRSICVTHGVEAAREYLQTLYLFLKDEAK